MIQQNLHEANRCHRCVSDAYRCFLHHVIESKGGAGGGVFVCPDPCQQVPTYWAPTVIIIMIIIIFVFYLQDWQRRFPGVVLMPLTELCLMYFYIPDAETEREKKERKMSGEERNTRKPCPWHKTATMIAYRSPLPNNRRLRQG